MPSLAESPATIAARDLWKRLAPSPVKRLIDAEPESVLREKEKRCQTKHDREQHKNRNYCALLFLAYFFDADRFRYITGDRRLLTARGIKQGVNTFAEKVQNQLGAITSRLTDGQIGLPEYAVAMAQKVEAAHTAAYSVGAGGLERTTGDLSAKAGQAVDYHLGKLNGFVNDLRRGGVTPEAAAARARLYGASVSTTYEVGHDDGLHVLAMSGVKIEVRNILGNAEHCSSHGFTTGCTEETERGWVEYGTMSLPGTRTCGPNCKCRVDHRIAQA